MQDVTTRQTSTLTAFFDTRDEADRAVGRLREADVPEASIRLTEGAQDRAGEVRTDEYGEESKGFFQSLSDFFVPDEDRHTYAEGLARGGYLLTVVDLPQESYPTALDILDDEGAVNIDEREEAWRAEGWTGYAPGTTAEPASAGYATGATAEPAPIAGERAPARGDVADGTIEVMEENIRLGKRDVSHGKVRVRSYVREEPVSADVDLTEERVTLDRRPVDRLVTGDEGAFTDRTIEAEETAEHAVVAKETRVVEEIDLVKDRDTHTETVSDTVRHTEVEIDDDRSDADRPMRDDRR